MRPNANEIFRDQESEEQLMTESQHSDAKHCSEYMDLSLIAAQ
jgi:hypothetical protein